MAKALNTFLKSKMNKDLDARIVPSGEYRNAVNIQISRSEGDSVGSVENILGNNKVFDFQARTGVANLYCIGYATNDQLNTVYVFLTDWPTPTIPIEKAGGYSTTANNFIFACNVQSNTLTLLVEGAFLNFSQLNPIYGVNVLENLLFWTDNRNQPRKINLDLANPANLTNPTYYTTEDQISVAKYNPYSCMELYQKSFLSTGDNYESTMKDVVSKFYPNGGAGVVKTTIGATPQTTVELTSFEGDIVVDGGRYVDGASLAYIDNSTGLIIPIASSEVLSYTFTDGATPFWTITATSAVFANLNAGTEIILNYNPYYDPDFAGDPDFLEDKFSRFSYRFQFEDNEYSLIAPFTQIAFIPKQDGYFMYVKQDNISEVDDQSDAYRSTVVSFVENKVNDIELRIPLPYLNYNIEDSLKIKNIDILYKESDAVAIKVVDTLPVSDIASSAGTFKVNGAVAAPGSTSFAIDNLQGGINVGDLVTGFGITGKPKVTSYEPTNLNNPSTGGTIHLSVAQTLVDDAVLNTNNPNYFVYNYQSKKPFKTLPENVTTRVFDKIPVRAFAQEVSGNRVIYGNYQDKHTPPASLNYNVAVSDKSAFNLNREEGTVDVGTVSGNTITIAKGADAPNVGDFISLITGTGNIPPNTQITSVTETTPGSGVFVIILSNTVTNIIATNVVLYEAGGDTENNTSIIEYPNSSLKTNRNYQAGVVLSDRYGRTSSVLLSNNKDTVKVGTFSFSGDTIYSSYKNKSGFYAPNDWPGDSLKLLFNETISSFKNTKTGTPGLYNGDSTDANYNPLGWYTYKIVIKQTEQDYYNVYLPGIMASYPQDQTLELGKTSHMVLINDNINKVPRDLSEVGPEQRQFRSSVQLFGRVENTSTAITASNIGSANTQYYPKRSSDTVSTISTVSDLFEYSPFGEDVPRPNYFPQFYSLDSSPLIARISTNKQIGQISTTNYQTVTATIGVSEFTNILKLSSTSGNTGGIAIGDIVSGPGFPENLKASSTFTAGASLAPFTVATSGSSGNVVETTTSPLPTPNSVVSGTGIPKGTVITSASGTSVVLSNIVNVSPGQIILVNDLATITVDQAVNAVINTDIIITKDADPGIQYLAVYETEPQESLLDIFWETSTSGLISDLNNAILNESSGGASLFGFNPDIFKEDLVAGANVSSSTILIVDNFNSPVPNASIQSPLGSALEITSQSDLNGALDVDYFKLIEVNGSGNNGYNIEILPAYFNNVYYSDNPNERNFIIELKAVVNNLESVFELNLNLINIDPIISSPSPAPPIQTQTTAAGPITTLKCKNGSANVLLSSIFNFDSNNPGFNDIVISQVTNSNGDDVTNNGYFGFANTPILNPTSGEFELNVLNTGGENTPTDRYNVTITVQDAGNEADQATVSFVVDYGVTVENVTTYALASTVKDNNGLRGPSDASTVIQYYTTFEVTAGPAGALGFYLYNGPWDSTNGDGITLSPVSNGYQPFPTNTDQYYFNQAFIGSTSYDYENGTNVSFLVNGGDNNGFGPNAGLGGGIKRLEGTNNLTIMGGSTDVNITYPDTGARLIKQSTEAACVFEWRSKCKYIRRDSQSVPATEGVPYGIFGQQDGSTIDDAVFVGAAPWNSAGVAIPQSVVNQYNWQVEL